MAPIAALRNGCQGCWFSRERLGNNGGTNGHIAPILSDCVCLPVAARTHPGWGERGGAIPLEETLFPFKKKKKKKKNTGDKKQTYTARVPYTGGVCRLCHTGAAIGKQAKSGQTYGADGVTWAISSSSVRSTTWAKEKAGFCPPLSCLRNPALRLTRPRAAEFRPSIWP